MAHNTLQEQCLPHTDYSFESIYNVGEVLVTPRMGSTGVKHASVEFLKLIYPTEGIVEIETDRGRACSIE